ncbi:MAG TPA: NADP-dependent oxidoreductase [Blastocatellia bacterium]|nr:NADP-dependent oxidoreductase [Blastocatellia bacterium]
MSTNRQILLAARPVGFPKDSDFSLVESPITKPAPGQILVRSIYVSVDPYMRGRMNDVKSYAPPVQIGGLMGGGAVGRVLESNNPTFNNGDIVTGMFGWQEYAVSDGEGVRKVDPALAPISTSLGILGMPGLTAYFGLLEICNPQPGETVVVSGAAGAVGSLVGQIAKIKGCRAIGIAGGDDKIAYITGELGFDGGFNYKGVGDYVAKLQELCPSGIDVYFDNVGGEITDAVLRLINTKARISICGQISQYNLEKIEMGPRIVLTSLLVKQARAEGFLVFQFVDKYPQALKQMADWLRAGQLKYSEDIAEGIENTPRAFMAMLSGRNTGKQLVRVWDEG